MRAAVAISALHACTLDPIDYSGKACGAADGTCPEGWTCDPSSSVCVRGDSSTSPTGGAGGRGGSSGGAGATGGECIPAPEECRTPPVDEDCNGVANDHCAEWSAQLSRPGFLQLPFDVAIDPVAGSVVVAGQSTANSDDDVMVAAFTADGQPAWTLDAGDTAPQEVQSLAFTETGDLVLAGFFRGVLTLGTTTLTSAGGDDVFVAKALPGGEVTWAARIGGPQNEVGVAVALAARGGFVITGRFQGAGAFGVPSNGGYDAFVARLDAQGALMWSHVFGGPADDSADHVQITADGDIAVVGSVEGTVDFGAGEVVTEGLDAFAAVWSDDGDLRWAHTFGGPLDQAATAVAVDAAGDVYLAGSFASSIDFLGEVQLTAVGARDAFVAKLSADGASHLWSHGFGAPAATQSAENLAVVQGAVFAAGTMDGPVDFGGGVLDAQDPPDVFLLSMDTVTGAHRYSRRFGLSGNQGYRAMAMQAGPAGLVLAADLSDGSVDFGAGVLTSSDPADAVVAKFAP